MFKGHPKGLYALALANTGERFGYYTMLAIFVLFLQAKFGYNEAQAGNIYGIFLGCVYFMPLIGGMLADRFGYGKMVKTGIVVMFLGYLLLAVPMATTTAKVTMFSALALIAIGNLFIFVGPLMYNAWPIWVCWTVFFAVCIVSMSIMLGMVKWLERVTA